MARPAPFDIDMLAASRHSAPNRYLGNRFDEHGAFLPDPGNTIVRHVVPGSATERALVKLRRRLRALPWGHRFAFTDVESLHMTLFEGVLEKRRLPNHWPEPLSLDTPLDEVTGFLADRLGDFEGPGSFNMRIAEVTPLGLTLTGATDADEACARRWRNALTEVMGYRAPNHDAYTFHVTLAYVIDWLPDDMLAEYRTALAELTREFAERVPVVELGPPCFCTFADMNSFPPLLTLGGTGSTRSSRLREADWQRRGEARPLPPGRGSRGFASAASVSRSEVRGLRNFAPCPLIASLRSALAGRVPRCLAASRRSLAFHRATGTMKFADANRLLTPAGRKNEPAGFRACSPPTLAVFVNGPCSAPAFSPAWEKVPERSEGG